MIKVYHAKNPTFFAPKNAPKISDYALMADVDTESLEGAYALTNNIDRPWIYNHGVKFYGSLQHVFEGCRSTSVGDVLYHLGNFYVVDSIGFKRVEVVA